VSTQVSNTEVTRKEKLMNQTIGQQLAALQHLTIAELKNRYVELFGEHTPANNRIWLIKRIAWRLQALAEGGLSERARQRAAELANDADLRLNPPVPRRPANPAPAQSHIPTAPKAIDKRLPPAGTILVRKYKGATLQVQVLQQGFAYNGQVFKSLSAVAKAITGGHCNGYWFFGLGQRGANNSQNACR
jgi:hypothetical protein